MSQLQTPVWKQETRFLGVVLPVKKRNRISQSIFSCIALLGASSVITLYLVIPLTLLLTPFHDWLAQLIGALCILIFIEGFIGITLLKIAQSIRVKRAEDLALPVLPIEYEETVYLPLLGPQDLLEREQPVQRVPVV